jgi:glycosyltransferase involved in cell wall biosynthesis
MKTPMALVSIIVPNYNHASYLPKRITSILQQTFTDYEVLLLDDASTDDSLTIINTYKNHPKFHILVNTKNSGSPFKQWNKGVSLAQGELIWIAESDDFSGPYFLEKLTAVLLNNPHVGLAYCQSHYVNEFDKIIGTPLDAHKRLHRTLWQEDFVMNGREMLGSYMVIKNVIPSASAVVFRKHLFQAVGGAAEDLSIGGDWMTWTKILLISDIGYVAQPLNYFRVHQTTVRCNLGRQQQINECVKVQKFICQNTNISREIRRKAVVELLKYFWQRPEKIRPGEFTLRGFIQIMKDVYHFSGGIHACIFVIAGLLSLFFVSLFGPPIVRFAQYVYRAMNNPG